MKNTSRYNENIEYITTLFSSLVSHAETLAFPDYRKGILAPQDMVNWGWLRKRIYEVAHPFSLDRMMKPSLRDIGIFLVWVYLALIGWPIGLDLTSVGFYGQLSNFQVLDIFKHFYLPYGILSTVALIPVAYYWWYEVFSDRRYQKPVRIILVLTFLAGLGDFAWQAATRIPNVQITWAGMDKLFVLLIYPLLVIPTVTFIVALLLNFVLLFIFLLLALFGGISSMHDPLPLNRVKMLATKEISTTEPNKPSWRLANLQKSEIITLQNWAKENRDATEKRTLPFSIVLGILGVIALSDIVRLGADDVLNNLLQNLHVFIYPDTSIAPLDLFGRTLIIGMTLGVLAILANGLKRLFVNLAVQNIVIEACLIAAFAKEKEDVQQRFRARSIINLIIDWILKFL
jgi:hypothetical protein